MTIEVTVKQQGAPVFNSAYVVRRSRHIAVIAIDMASKYTSADWSSGHEVTILANERSLHLDPSKDAESFTTLAVEGMPKGFSLFATGGGRYTINLVYVRDVTKFEWRLQDWKYACIRAWDKLFTKEEVV